MPYQKAQISFMELVQTLLFLSTRAAACTKETEPEELPTNQREGQAGQASFAQCSCRRSDCSGFCSQCLYPLRECSAEKEGNWMKTSQSEEFFFSVVFTTSPGKTKMLQRRSRTSSSDTATYWFYW